ncbi:lipoyl(octanoyl) transferase LipB [Desulfovibrio inopinatus]|uniref:lipoyl(octanoyl) transferase LipB n=1 Tax=Desulfovibrio inopinatus TaxID=102109 RepID=UPI0004055CCC|nr:lipoyl(octanoyl) transferase LipB [Desulfovibrio inopinatus]
MTKQHDIRVLWLRSLDYQICHALQKKLVEQIIAGEGPETLLFVEHHPVITTGRRTQRSDILASADQLAQEGITIYDVERGGLATYHGPGQLVIYPILNLRTRKLGIKEYVHLLESMVIEALAHYGISGLIKKGFPGVWTSPSDKIASLGVAVLRGVCYHGIALNCSTNLNHFNMINPCGIDGVRMVSMKSICEQTIPLDELQRVCVEAFKTVFGIPCRIHEDLPEDIRTALGLKPCPICWACGACETVSQSPYEGIEII